MRQLLPQRTMQTAARIFRQRHSLRIAINIDSLLASIHHNPASLAFGQMLFELHAQLGAKRPIQVPGQLFNHIGTLHAGSLRRKYRFTFWRNFKRARSSRDFTAGTERCSTSAVSSVDISSMSRSWKTILKLGSSSEIAEFRISCNCVCSKRSAGEGPQSSTSRKKESSPVSISSSNETWLGRRFRNFISAWFTAIRTSQV